jgi:glycosyltransferase involved in cell wall biosynthesis
MASRSEGEAMKTLAVWIGSPAKLPALGREGIFRFIFNLVKHLARRHPLRFEIWCLQINLPQVRELFSPLLGIEEAEGTIVFRTEMSAFLRSAGRIGRMRRLVLLAAAAVVHCLKAALFASRDLLRRNRRAVLLAAAALLLLGFSLAVRAGWPGRQHPWAWSLLPLLLLPLVFAWARGLLEGLATRGWDAFMQGTNMLPRAAGLVSDAGCFLIQNIDMANAWTIQRPKIVNLHDLFIAEFAPLFTRSGRARRLLIQGRKAVRCAEKLASQGALFVCNSDEVRRRHALALIPGLKPENTEVVFLPVIVPAEARRGLPDAEAVRAEFAIPGAYAFYPSQVRPYKNIMTLLRALRIVRDGGNDLSLVLTGNLADEAECADFVRRNHLQDRVILTGPLSETRMYALYRHAALVAVPTLAESSFPWQALEAMAMEVPVIVSRIPVVEERLRFHGLAADSCGLLTFEPRDAEALARGILHVLSQRDRVLAEQGTLRRTLLAYDWDQLADRYYGLIDRMLAGAERGK